ncbi:MAG: hypothetical protein U1F87_11720, partial [Kiritimatiellia bacterium]
MTLLVPTACTEPVEVLPRISVPESTRARPPLLSCVPAREQRGDRHGVEHRLRAGFRRHVDGLLPFGEDLRGIGGVEQAQLERDRSLVVGEVVHAADDAEFIALAQEGRGLEVDKEVLARDRLRGDLADQCFDRAPARGQPPGGGGFRHRHGNDGLAVRVGDNRGQPAALAADFAAGGGGSLFTGGPLARHGFVVDDPGQVIVWSIRIPSDLTLLQILQDPPGNDGGSAVGVQSVEDQGAGAIAHHRLRGLGLGRLHAAAQFGELVALLIAAGAAAGFGHDVLRNRSRHPRIAEPACRPELELRVAAGVLLEEFQ